LTDPKCDDPQFCNEIGYRLYLVEWKFVDKLATEISNLLIFLLVKILQHMILLTGYRFSYSFAVWLQNS